MKLQWPGALWRGSLAIAIGVLGGTAAAVIGIHAALPSSPPAAAAAAPVPATTVIDVSRAGLERAGAIAGLAGLLGADATHPITMIDGAAVHDGLRDLAAAWDVTAPGDYLDVGVGSRRFVVLVHP